MFLNKVAKNLTMRDHTTKESISSYYTDTYKP
jgi:hypothetical protein